MKILGAILLMICTLQANAEDARIPFADINDCKLSGDQEPMQTVRRWFQADAFGNTDEIDPHKGFLYALQFCSICEDLYYCRETQSSWKNTIENNESARLLIENMCIQKGIFMAPNNQFISNCKEIDKASQD